MFNFSCKGTKLMIAYRCLLSSMERAGESYVFTRRPNIFAKESESLGVNHIF